MKKPFLTIALFAVLALAGAVAQAAGVPVLHYLQSPEIAIGLGGLGMAGITTFVQPGDVIDLAPGADVPSGTGYLFGAALFGVAVVDAKNGVASSFITEGVVTIAKTSALAISVGDRLFWDSVNKCVNKTTTAQQQVGIAVEAAGNPSGTVKMLLESAVPVAT